MRMIDHLCKQKHAAGGSIPFHTDVSEHTFNTGTSNIFEQNAKNPNIYL